SPTRPAGRRPPAPESIAEPKRRTPAWPRYRGRRRRTSDDMDGQRRRTDPRPCGRRGHADVRRDRSPHQLCLRAALLQVQGSREASSSWPPPTSTPTGCAPSRIRTDTWQILSSPGWVSVASRKQVASGEHIACTKPYLVIAGTTAVRVRYG